MRDRTASQISLSVYLLRSSVFMFTTTAPSELTMICVRRSPGIRTVYTASPCGISTSMISALFLFPLAVSIKHTSHSFRKSSSCSFPSCHRFLYSGDPSGGSMGLSATAAASARSISTSMSDIFFSAFTSSCITSSSSLVSVLGNTSLISSGMVNITASFELPIPL